VAQCGLCGGPISRDEFCEHPDRGMCVHCWEVRTVEV
jgi:hypothetical protein